MDPVVSLVSSQVSNAAMIRSAAAVPCACAPLAARHKSKTNRSTMAYAFGIAGTGIEAARCGA